MASRNTTLYDQVLTITTDYLGPASQRFIDRQIDNHLNKTPDKLTKQDLTILVEWTRVSMALLTDDTKILDSYVKSILKLSANGT